MGFRHSAHRQGRRRGGATHQPFSMTKDECHVNDGDSGAGSDKVVCVLDSQTCATKAWRALGLQRQLGHHLDRGNSALDAARRHQPQRAREQAHSHHSSCGGVSVILHSRWREFLTTYIDEGRALLVDLRMPDPSCTSSAPTSRATSGTTPRTCGSP